MLASTLCVWMHELVCVHHVCVCMYVHAHVHCVWQGVAGTGLQHFMVYPLSIPYKHACIFL